MIIVSNGLLRHKSLGLNRLQGAFETCTDGFRECFSLIAIRGAAVGGGYTGAASLRRPRTAIMEGNRKAEREAEREAAQSRRNPWMCVG